MHSPYRARTDLDGNHSPMRRASFPVCVSSLFPPSRPLHSALCRVAFGGRGLPAGETAMMRTHTCGQLRATDNGRAVELCVWVDTVRDHGGLIFIDLRDRFGLTQVVFDPKDSRAS